MKYTHKGWFFMCPVYLNANEGDGMRVEARHPWFEWWFTVNQWLHEASCYLCDCMGIDYQPGFPFRITGELKKY